MRKLIHSILFLLLLTTSVYSSDVHITDPYTGKRASVSSEGALSTLPDNPTDEITGALVQIDYAHYEMHEGDHYFIKTFIFDTGGTGNTTLFAFTTPTNGRRIHAKALLAPDVDFEISIYEGSVITGGTPVAGINNDRDSTNVAGLTAVASPTHVIPGLKIWTARNGGGKNAVGVAPGLNYEIIAKTNSTYVFEIIKRTTADGVVDIDFFWYEHTPSN